MGKDWSRCLLQISMGIAHALSFHHHPSRLFVGAQTKGSLLLPNHRLSLVHLQDAVFVSRITENAIVSCPQLLFKVFLLPAMGQRSICLLRLRLHGVFFLPIPRLSVGIISYPAAFVKRFFQLSFKLLKLLLNLRDDTKTNLRKAACHCHRVCLGSSEPLNQALSVSQRFQRVGRVSRGRQL